MHKGSESLMSLAVIGFTNKGNSMPHRSSSRTVGVALPFASDGVGNNTWVAAQSSLVGLWSHCLVDRILESKAPR